MQTLKFITKDQNNNAICWCTTNTLKGFRNFMQYILDSFNNVQDFMLWDTKSDKVYNAYDIATKQYNMRKRTFNERMNDIQTGKWENVSL